MSDIAGLSTADLQALRLAAQVFRHRAAIQGHPCVERYWATLNRAVDFALAGRGIGFVVGSPSPITLGEEADAADRALLDEHLALLVDNEQLPAPVREVCAELRQRATA